MPLGCHLVPKVSQSDPKGLPNGAPGARFDYFFCKKPTLHPTAYLVCFRYILRVLGSPVLKKFIVEMCVGSRSPKKAVTLSLFLIFRRKCVKMGAQTGGGKSPKNCLFSHWSPFGCPWVHFPWLLGSLGIILAPFWVPWPSFWHPWAPPKWCPGSAKFNENEASNQPGWVHFCWILKSLGIILAPLGPPL